MNSSITENFPESTRLLYIFTWYYNEPTNIFFILRFFGILPASYPHWLCIHAHVCCSEPVTGLLFLWCNILFWLRYQDLQIEELSGNQDELS